MKLILEENLLGLDQLQNIINSIWDKSGVWISIKENLPKFLELEAMKRK